MNAWLDGDLEGLVPRNELSRLRDVLDRASADGRDTRALWHALAELDTVATAELAVGPRAPSDANLVAAALDVVHALEEVVAPSGLYARLASLAPSLGAQILQVAASRHPAATWIARLARFEERPGAAQLAAAGDDLAGVTRAVARSGGVRALVHYAAEHGRLEPALALLRTGDLDGCARAAAAALEANPAVALVPDLAAVWGPDLDAVLVRVVPHLSGASARRALAMACTDFPGTRALLGD